MTAATSASTALYADVKERIADMNAYLDADSLRRQANTVVRLTVVTMFGLIRHRDHGFLGMTLLAEADAPMSRRSWLFAVVFVLTDGADLLHHRQVEAPVGLPRRAVRTSGFSVVAKTQGALLAVWAANELSDCKAVCASGAETGASTAPRAAPSGWPASVVKAWRSSQRRGERLLDHRPIAFTAGRANALARALPQRHGLHRGHAPCFRPSRTHRPQRRFARAGAPRALRRQREMPAASGRGTQGAEERDPRSSPGGRWRSQSCSVQGPSARPAGAARCSSRRAAQPVVRAPWRGARSPARPGRRRLGHQRQFGARPGQLQLVRAANGAGLRLVCNMARLHAASRPSE
jgi:hypothetical protein